MRSVYAKIFVWMLGTLVFTLGAFYYTTVTLAFRGAGRIGGMERTMLFQFAEARMAYERGGSKDLQAYLGRLKEYFASEHHLTDATGRDLVSGEDRSALLKQLSDENGPPYHLGDKAVIARTSQDGRYRFIAVVHLPATPWSFLPYYLLILVAVAGLCWLLAVNLVSPLRKLAVIVNRFGRGDLSARVGAPRRDEFGDVGRAFNEMAERIQTLLTAERRLLQDISHELRSPLARLSFAAELTRTASDRETAVARVRKEIDRLSDLVNALIEMTRLEGDPTSHPMQDIALDALLREVAEDCNVEANARGCILRLTEDAAPALQGDPELLRRAIENVLRNAIRYAPQGSEIEVRLETRPTGASISIRDQGPGVPEELLPKIFQPFFRVDDSRNGSTGGVGLGLAIAYRAVHVHHGTLSAENAHPGLRVRIDLPAAV